MPVNTDTKESGVKGLYLKQSTIGSETLNY